MPWNPTRINTDIGAMVDRQTGSGFGGNLLRAFGMMQQGQQANKATEFREKEFAAQQLDKDRAYNMLSKNLENEQLDKDVLGTLVDSTNGDIDKLDDELAKFSPRSLFGIKAHGVLQNQTKTHLMEKKALQTKNYFEDSARKNLDPEDYATWVNMENNPETGFPGQDKITFLNERVKSKQTSPNFKNLPLDAQLYETMLGYEEKGDSEGAGVMRDTIERRRGSAFSKADDAALKDAYARRRQAERSLQDAKTNLIPASKAAAEEARDKANADLSTLLKPKTTKAAPQETITEEVITETPAAPAGTNSPISLKWMFDKSGNLVPQ